MNALVVVFAPNLAITFIIDLRWRAGVFPILFGHVGTSIQHVRLNYHHHLIPERIKNILLDDAGIEPRPAACQVSVIAITLLPLGLF